MTTSTSTSMNTNTDPRQRRGNTILLASRAASTKSKSKTSPKNTGSKTKAKPYKLVIVESPSKASTISTILNKYAAAHNFPYKYVVDSCRGHVRDLPRSAKEATNESKKSRVLGVDVTNGYEPQYVVPSDKMSTVSHLRSLADVGKGCVWA